MDNTTLLDIVKTRYPVVFQKWDGWDYRVFSPLSLDDVAFVTVILKNENKTEQRLEIPIGRV